MVDKQIISLTLPQRKYKKNIMTDLESMVIQITEDYTEERDRRPTDLSDKILSLAKQEVYLNIMAFANRLSIDNAKQTFCDSLQPLFNDFYLAFKGNKQK